MDTEELAAEVKRLAEEVAIECVESARAGKYGKADSRKSLYAAIDRLAALASKPDAAPAGGAVQALSKRDIQVICHALDYWHDDFDKCQAVKRRLRAALAAAPVVPPQQYGDFDKLMSEHPPSEADRQRVRDALAALPVGASPCGGPGSAASRPEPQSVSALRAPIPGAGRSWADIAHEWRDAYWNLREYVQGLGVDTTCYLPTKVAPNPPTDSHE